MKVESYKKLTKVEEFDRELVEELAALHNEMAEVASRLREMEELAQENKKFDKHLWQTADGRVMPIHKMEDAHLINAMGHLIRNGRSVPKPMKIEARLRGLAVPIDSQRNTTWLDEAWDLSDTLNLPMSNDWDS